MVLIDAHRREPLRAEFLVHAEEVDLDGRHVTVDGRVRRVVEVDRLAVAVGGDLAATARARARAGAAAALSAAGAGRGGGDAVEQLRWLRLHTHALAVEQRGCARDEGDELLRLRHTHAHMPLRLEAGRRESPP